MEAHSAVRQCRRSKSRDHRVHFYCLWTLFQTIAQYTRWRAKSIRFCTTLTEKGHCKHWEQPKWTTSTIVFCGINPEAWRQTMKYFGAISAISTTVNSNAKSYTTVLWKNTWSISICIPWRQANLRGTGTKDKKLCIMRLSNCRKTSRYFNWKIPLKPKLQSIRLTSWRQATKNSWP